jgi:hypothetical protein
VALVVDTSASMAMNDPNAVLRQAVGRMIEGLPDDDLVGLLTFDSHARVITPARRLGEPGARESLRSSVEGLEFEGRYTNIADAVERGLYDLQRSIAGDGPRLLVLVTDGLIDTGSAAEDEKKEAWLHEDLLPACREAGIRIFGVAFTEDADYELLRAMARETGGGYYRALTEADVPGIFAELEAALAAPPPREAAPPPREAAPPTPTPLGSRPAPGSGPVGEPGPPGLSPTATAGLVLGALAVLVATIALLRSRRRDDALPVTEAVLHDLATGVQLPLSKRITRIGRADDNDVVIDSGTVSGRHALIEARGGVYHVADLRSTNGTFVNEKRIEGETVLRRGDILRFDRFKYAFDGVAIDEEATQVSLDEEKTQIRVSPWADPDGRS